MLCEDALPVAEMEAAIKQGVGSILEDVSIFDVYKGKQIKAGKKSVSFSIRMRSHEATLTDEQADRAMQRALKALNAIGAQLRESYELVTMKKKQVETAKTKESKNLFHRLQKEKQRTAKEDSALVLAILAIAFAVLAVLSALFLPTALQLATLLLGCIGVLCGFGSLMFGKTGTVLSVLSILIGFACILLYVIATRLSQG